MLEWGEMGPRSRPKPRRFLATPWGLARKRAGLSVREAEAKSGISRVYISWAEAGRFILSPDQAAALLIAYGQVKAVD